MIPVLIVVATTLAMVMVLGVSAAYAADATPTVRAVASIDQVINNMRFFVTGILAAWATLCLTVAFLRYTSGEADEVERGKRGLRSAVIGYIGALLAPLIVTIVRGWVA